MKPITCDSMNFGQMTFSLGAALRCGQRVDLSHRGIKFKDKNDKVWNVCGRHAQYFKDELASGKYMLIDVEGD